MNTARVLRATRATLDQYGINSNSKDKDLRKAIAKIREELSAAGVNDPSAGAGAAEVAPVAPQKPQAVTRVPNREQPPKQIGGRSPLQQVYAEDSTSSKAPNVAQRTTAETVFTGSIARMFNKKGKNGEPGRVVIDANSPEVQTLLRSGVTAEEIQEMARREVARLRKGKEMNSAARLSTIPER